MRPSGRKARRQGSSKVLTVVILKGRLGSGFWSPALTWAQAAADARLSSNTAFANFIVISPCFSRAVLRDAGALSVVNHILRWGSRHEALPAQFGAGLSGHKGTRLRRVIAGKHFELA